jgi:hypothetical protein
VNPIYCRLVSPYECFIESARGRSGEGYVSRLVSTLSRRDNDSEELLFERITRNLGGKLRGGAGGVVGSFESGTQPDFITLKY